jgi:hypothetical protein
MRLDFSRAEINQMVKEQLKAWDGTDESDRE